MAWSAWGRALADASSRDAAGRTDAFSDTCQAVGFLSLSDGPSPAGHVHELSPQQLARVRPLSAADAPSRLLSFSPAWRLLAAAMSGGVVALWDVRVRGRRGPAAALRLPKGSHAPPSWVQRDLISEISSRRSHLGDLISEISSRRSRLGQFWCGVGCEWPGRICGGRRAR
jgi:hypothetical protein